MQNHEAFKIQTEVLETIADVCEFDALDFASRHLRLLTEEMVVYYSLN